MKDERLQVASKIKDIILFFRKLLINYPKKEYILKDKIETTSYEILELVYFANTMEERSEYQKRILSKIAMLDFYLELSYNSKCISLKNLNTGARLLTEIRKMIYGWMKINGSKI